MSWTPKPGDRVTSPLLVGEWEVLADGFTDTPVEVRLTHVGDYALARVPAASLSPVAPPLPPEPPIGSVVRAHGALWRRNDRGRPDWAGWACGESWSYKSWPDLATAPDLSPVVAVEDVADWMRQEFRFGRAVGATRFLAEFGGFDA